MHLYLESGNTLKLTYRSCDHSVFKFIKKYFAYYKDSWLHWPDTGADM